MAQTETSHKFEPQRRFRWLLQMENIDAFIVKRVTRPVAFPSPNGLTSRDVEIELYDPIAPNGALMAYEWCQKRDERNITLKMLDPIGTVIETWTYEKAKPTYVDFGEISHEPREPAIIKVTFEFTKCSYE